MEIGPVGKVRRRKGYRWGSGYCWTWKLLRRNRPTPLQRGPGWQRVLSPACREEGGWLRPFGVLLRSLHSHYYLILTTRPQALTECPVSHIPGWWTWEEGRPGCCYPGEHVTKKEKWKGWAAGDGRTQLGQALGEERSWAGTTLRWEWRREGLTRDQNKVMTTTRCARSVRKREGTSPVIRPMAPRGRGTSWSRSRGL